MSAKKQNEEFTVAVSHQSIKGFGACIAEVWRIMGGDQYRPNNMPSLTLYEPKTGSKLLEQWTVWTGDFYRDRGHRREPTEICYDARNPYMKWHRRTGDVHVARPVGKEVDPETGTVKRFIYGGALRDQNGRLTSRSLPYPTYDR